jgi:hypothetical protein
MAATATCASPPPPALPAADAVAGPSAQSAPPAPASQRPPLARRPRGTSTASRAGGVRRRVPSGAAADSDNSSPDGAASSSALSRTNALRAFLSCVAEETRELVAAFHALVCSLMSGLAKRRLMRFVLNVKPASDQRFPQFKALWLARRMSALFHVEFWDSTPTDTHHAVLQVALGAFVLLCSARLSSKHCVSVFAL